MAFKLSTYPGGHERHCLRQVNNKELFAIADLNSDHLHAIALAKDEALAEQFAEQFEAVLHQAVALKPTEETDVVMAVKAELDRLYSLSHSVRGEQSRAQEGLERLLALSVQSIKKAAGDDAQAITALEEEAEARALHHQHLQCALVADLLNADSLDEGFIPPEDLVPSLLSAQKADLAEAVQLFDRTQVIELITQAEQLMQRVAEGSKTSSSVSTATEKLAFIKGYAVYLEQAEGSV